MYIPKQFSNVNQQGLIDFIKDNSFATVISNSSEGMMVSHLPLIHGFEGEEAYLYGHFAKANPHWKDFSGNVTAIFHGPHSYISSSWYEEEGTVPTWNYTAVHASGQGTIMRDRAELITLLSDSVDFFESKLGSDYRVDFKNPVIQKEMDYIVGFKIKIDKLEGKWKLNQHHTPERKQKTINNLKKVQIYDSQEIAALMEKTLKK
jgi:transcriptional regulator